MTIRVLAKEITNKKVYRNILIVASSTLIAVTLLTAQFSRQPGVIMMETAQYFSVITLIAIGIERVMEGFWTVIDVYKDSWWPVNFKSMVNQFTSGLEKEISPFMGSVDELIEKIQKSELDKDKIEQAHTELLAIKGRIEELKNTTANVQQIRSILASASTTIELIDLKYPELKKTVEFASDAIDIMSRIIETIKDNPGRRLISLYTGALVGSILAGVLGLDEFVQITGTPLAAGAIFPNWGVALTGLLIGLGTSPTHEVIRAIQEMKNSQKK